MEERLFWIGVGMGVYLWATQLLGKKGVLEHRLRFAFWHSLFWMGAAFGAGTVLARSFESRGSFGPLGGPGGGKYLPALLAAGAGAWTFWTVFAQGKVAKERHRVLLEDKEWGETIFSAVLLAAFLMYFILQAFKIPSGSMRDTLLEGDHLFVNKFIYGVRVPLTSVRLGRLRPIRRGDIVVFEFPTKGPQEIHCGSSQSGKDFIKRVVGLPDDVIEVRNGNLIVNGAVQEEPYVSHSGVDADPPSGQFEWQRRFLVRPAAARTAYRPSRDTWGPLVVPRAHYFMLGDNRDNSEDSRYWGFVPDSLVRGRPMIVYFSYEPESTATLGILPHVRWRRLFERVR